MNKFIKFFKKYFGHMRVCLFCGQVCYSKKVKRLYEDIAISITENDSFDDALRMLDEVEVLTKGESPESTRLRTFIDFMRDGAVNEE